MRWGNDTLGLLSVILVFLVAGLSAVLDGEEPSIRQAPDTAVRRPPVTAPRQDLAALPQISITVDAKRDSSGTAFAVGDGVWVTARHVVDGCDVVGVLTPPGRGDRASRIAVHPNADVATMSTGRSGPPVRLADTLPARGDIAYHIGYPRGQPGALRSRMMGLRTMNVGGRYSTREVVIAWAEIERFPDDPRPLSGLSGGPVFDAEGRVVGVHVAGSVRRGRSFTAHPDSLRTMVEAAGVGDAGRWAEARFTPESMVRVGDELRGAWSVAKALCDVR